ncbi:MAG: hypothetical protein IKF90_07265 [Parasporobacterium sp.]|nr:hypothetical protein [Parasporobacterium sp.]
MAPTEVLWTREDGDLFVSDSDILAQMWYDGIKVNPTGEWTVFHPEEVK